jgi:serine/threonine protein phosphatase PrpC
MTALRYGAATDVGEVRTENQDAFHSSAHLWLVADGMGGHRGGEVASAIATETVVGLVGAEGGAVLPVAVEQANTAVITKSLEDPGLAGMGTTMTAIALVRGEGADGTDVLRLVNVGDSRTYRLTTNDTVVEQVTVDHSLVAQWEREGRITADQALTHPQRNVITRALGVDAVVEVDTWDLPLVTGDRYVLCSDGLTNEVDDTGITEVLRSVTEPADAAAELVRRANAAGGRDNVTVVVLDVVDAAPVPGTGPLDLPAPVDPVDPAGDPTGSSSTSASTTPARPEESVPRSRFTWRVAAFLGALVVLVAVTAGGVWLWARNAWFLGVDPGGTEVVVFQGRPPEGVLWFEPREVAVTGVRVDDLSELGRRTLDDPVVWGSQAEAEDQARRLGEGSRRVLASPTTTTPPLTVVPTTVLPPAPAPAPGA